MDTFAVKRTRFIGMFSSGMAVDESAERLYVGKPLRSRVDVYDLDTLKKIAQLPAGFGVRDVFHDADRNLLYTTNYFAGTCDVIDVQSKKRLARLYVGPLVRNLDVDVEKGQIYCGSACGIFEIHINELLGNVRPEG